MPVEGRALAGLDEFMLRLGHLTLLCGAAIENGGSYHRVEKGATARLTERVAVQDDVRTQVAAYLATKRLAPTLNERQSRDFDEHQFRYPDLVVTAEGQDVDVRNWPLSDLPPKVEWQDLCLAADGVASRVGAITTNAKRGSKTGLSHVFDWANMLDLVSSSGQPFVLAQLIARFKSPMGRNPNPYILGNERLVFGYLILRSDFDVFSKLADSLSLREGVIKKKDAVDEYVKAIDEIADGAERSRSLSQRQMHHLFSLWKDVRRSGREEIIGSTAWHRAASRFETYVDLGLLSKGEGGEQERYEYKYYVTERMRTIAATIRISGDAETWLNLHSVSGILGVPCSDELIAPERVVELLRIVAEPLARPTAPLPIEALTLGLVWLAADLSEPVTVGAARRSIENLAIKRPDIARLSTGTLSRPEYISIRFKDGPSKNGTSQKLVQ